MAPTPQKQSAVTRVAKLIDEYPIIGVVNMEQLPAGSLASMRKKMRKSVVISMTKKRLIKLAFKQSKKEGIDQLEPYLKGVPALLFTKDNPFALFKIIKKNQSPAPIKAGQEAPEDIVIPAGPTNFTPGPMIGELGQLGIKCGVEGGKIAIKQDATVARAGKAVDEKVASFLAKMNIFPMRIGLKLTAVYENGEVLKANVLDIDEKQFMADLTQAAGRARALALGAGILTKDTVQQTVAKAHYEAAGLALEANLITDENTRQLLAKAYWQALGVTKYLPDDMKPAQAAVEEAAPAAGEKKDDEKKGGEPAADAAAGLGALFG